MIKKKIIFISILLFSVMNVNSAPKDTDLKQGIRTGFYIKGYSDIDRGDLEIALYFWVKEISKDRDIKNSTFFYDNIDTMRDDFYQQKINIIFSSPLPIVESFDLSLFSDGYNIVWDGSAIDNILVLTHKDSSLNKFSDLKNKHLSILSNDPILQMYAEVLSLENFNKKPIQVFNNVSSVIKSSQLIFKLFFKKTDVIFVYEKPYTLAMELNPQIKKDTQVISVLSNIPRSLGFFHKNTDPSILKLALNNLLQLHKTAKGNQLLKVFHADKVIYSTTKGLQSTKELKQRHLQLLKKNNL